LPKYIVYLVVSSLSLSLSFKYQFKLSDLSTHYSILFSLTGTRQICNYLHRLTSLLSTPRSSIRFSIATWVNLKIAWLDGGVNKAKIRKRLLFTDSRDTRRRDNIICEVWINLRKTWSQLCAIAIISISFISRLAHLGLTTESLSWLKLQ